MRYIPGRILDPLVWLLIRRQHTAQQFIILWDNFTVLASYHGFHHDLEVSCRNMAFVFQSNPLGMCAWMFLIVPFPVMSHCGLAKVKPGSTWPCDFFYQSFSQSVSQSAGWMRSRSISLTLGREGRVRHHCGVVMMPFSFFPFMMMCQERQWFILCQRSKEHMGETGLCTVHRWDSHVFVCVTVSWHGQASVKCFTLFDVEQPGLYHSPRLPVECFDDASV